MDRATELRSPGAASSSIARLSSANPWGWLESLSLLGYAVVVALGIGWHEPWADEAQAWLMARDMSLLHMIFHGVRYEGSPALWDSILWVLIRLHASYGALRWAAGGLAVGGVVVLLRYAPFPRVLRLLLPFTFFLAYQDAVVARGYVLFALLTFGVVALLRRPQAHPLATVALLGLLANLSAHGFVVSAGLSLLALMQWRGQRIPRAHMLSCAAALVGMFVLAIGTTMPPADTSSPTGTNVARSWAKLDKSSSHSAKADTVSAGELTLMDVPTPARDRGVKRRIVRILSLITFPLSSYRVLGVATFIALLAVAFRPRRKGAPGGAMMLLPYALVLAVFQSMYLAPRHAGTLLVTFLAAGWLVWPQERKWDPWTFPFVLLLFLVTIEQIAWTCHAVWSDVYQAYSGGKMTATFLEQHLPGHRAAAFYYHAVDTLPYFDHNIYENQPTRSSWLWSTTNRIDPRAPLELEKRPDYVVLGGFAWGDNADINVDWEKPDYEPGLPLDDRYGIRRYFLAHGYQETHRFCGHSWMRSGYSELLCDVILEPARSDRGDR
jgi:hypothetical protein